MPCRRNQAQEARPQCPAPSPRLVPASPPPPARTRQSPGSPQKVLPEGPGHIPARNGRPHPPVLLSAVSLVSQGQKEPRTQDFPLPLAAGGRRQQKRNDPRDTGTPALWHTRPTAGPQQAAASPGKLYGLWVRTWGPACARSIPAKGVELGDVSPCSQHTAEYAAREIPPGSTRWCRDVQRLPECDPVSSSPVIEGWGCYLSIPCGSSPKPAVPQAAGFEGSSQLCLSPGSVFQDRSPGAGAGGGISVIFPVAQIWDQWLPGPHITSHGTGRAPSSLRLQHPPGARQKPSLKIRIGKVLAMFRNVK